VGHGKDVLYPYLKAKAVTLLQFVGPADYSLDTLAICDWNRAAEGSERGVDQKVVTITEMKPKDASLHALAEGGEAELGDRVRFGPDDVFLPRLDEESATPIENELEGVVIGFTDTCQKVRAFAVIEVARKQLMIVPMEKLRVGRGESRRNPIARAG
jgi:hypothetical protein